jgi:hypothetical protein
VRYTRKQEAVIASRLDALSRESDQRAPEQQVLQALMGDLLPILHRVEAAFAKPYILALVELEEIWTWSIPDIISERSRRTLGQLAHPLKGKAKLTPRFERLLLRFVKNRNRFCHSLSMEKGFSLSDSAGRKRLRNFLVSLLKDALYLEIVLFASTHAGALYLNDLLKTKGEKDLYPVTKDTESLCRFFFDQDVLVIPDDV